MIKPTRLLTWSCLLFAAHAARVDAQAFTRLVSFGDSLSDVGNVAAQTIGFSPGANYFQNRFSNGPIWVDSLSSQLNLGTSLNSRAGGYNYATGGTRSGTGYVTPFIFVNLPNAGQQVTDYLAARTPGVDELFTIWTGGNDFLDGQTNANIPANNVRTLLDRLATAGVKNVAIANLPPLGETPRYRTTTNRAIMNTRSSAFNAALATQIDSFQTANPTLNVFDIDVFGFFNAVLSSPASFGFTNVTDRALNGSTVVSNPDQYLFYDDVHPTRVAHALVGSIALESVTTRTFVGAANGSDNWSIAANWSAARVPDTTSSVRFESANARLGSAKNVRKLELMPTGRLTLELDANATGGRVAVSGAARLDGEIGVDFAGSFVGLPGQTLPLLSFASATGSPSLINLTGYAGLDLAPVQSASALSVLLSATAGDADLDADVDFNDLLTLAQNYLDTGRDWLSGDFTADQTVDFNDLLALARNYGQLVLTEGNVSALGVDLAADWALARSLVPEPVTGLATLAAVMLGSRRATCRRPVRPGA
jgi:thermolabile hemolysin